MKGRLLLIWCMLCTPGMDQIVGPICESQLHGLHQDWKGLNGTRGGPKTVQSDYPDLLILRDSTFSNLQDISATFVIQ